MNELRRIRDQVSCPHCGGVFDREIAVFTDQVIRDENARLRARIAELKALLKPFASIAPSSLHPGDGSDEEAYAVVLKGNYGNRAEFTGRDLARARAACKKAGE